MPKAPPDTAVPGVARGNAALLDAFAKHLTGRPEHTRGAYLRDTWALARLAGAAPLGTLTAPQLRRFLATLHGRGLAGRSLARMLSSWRSFYGFLLERDATVKENPCAGLKAPRSPKKLPSALSPDEAVRLVQIEARDPLAVRDRAWLELAYSSGLRLSELAGLDVDRLDLDNGEVRVWGKGAKERIVPVGTAAREALSAWLAVRATLKGANTKALFVGRSGARITPRAIERRLAEWAVKQGLPRHVHPHMLRHSFASHVLQSSGDLRAVQEMLGHASIASTQVYTHLDFQALAKVYDAAHPRAKKSRVR
ncbi:MAG: tyrosine-type recombinase/integrase [Aromatoleum sp.]|nr:tyrosine-type recombinase/integrase [Aromatoleum sp.]